MVFESLVTDLLNRYLGDYVENLDRSQMKLGIWSGDVSMKNLKLKQNALNELNLPVKVKSGSLANLTLKIPWSNLYKAPVVILLDGVHLLAVPNSTIKYDPVAEENAARDAKRRLIAAYEERSAASKKPTEENKEDSFTEKLVAQIVRNVQITVSNVHFRYEGQSSTGQRPFALGVLLRGIVVESTGENWQSSSLTVADNVQHFFKMVKLDSLAVYFNTDARTFSTQPHADHQALFASEIGACLNSPGHCQFLLSPIVLNTRLRINPKPELNQFAEAKVYMSSEMNELAVAMSRRQYQCIHELLQTMERLSVASVYRKYRPSVAVSDHALQWWRFAYKCILNESIRRRRRDWSWAHMKAYIEMSRRYHNAYKIKLTSKTVPADVTTRLADYEFKLDIVSIITVRQRAEKEVGRDRLQQQQKSAGGSWFGGWFGGGSAATTEDTSSDANAGKSISTQLRTAMTAEEREKLYAAIDYHERGSSASLQQIPADFEAVQVNFQLGRLTMAVLDSLEPSGSCGDGQKSCSVLQLAANSLGFSVVQRPAVSGVRVQLNLSDITAAGLDGGRGQRPSIVSSDCHDSSEKLFSLKFELHPPDGRCDSRLTITSRPVQVVFDAATFSRLSTVFESAGDGAVQLSQLQEAATSKLLEMKETSALKMQYVIESSSVFECDIQLMAPRLLVPEAGDIGRPGRLLALTLGKLCVKSVPRSAKTVSVSQLVKSGASTEQIYRTMAEHSYDWFEVSLSDAAAVIASPSEAQLVLKECGRGRQPEHMCLVQPISLSLRLAKCLIRDDTRLPLTKSLLEIPLLELRVSDFRLAQLAVLLDSVQIAGNSGKTGELSSTVNLASVDPSLSVGASSVPVDNLIVNESLSTETPELIDLQVSFDLRKFCVRVFSNKTMNQNCPEREVVQLAVVGVSCSASKTSRYLKADCSVADIAVKSLEFRDASGEHVVLLGCSHGVQPLLQLEYLNMSGKLRAGDIDDDVPKQKACLTVGSVDVLFHQQALMSLVATSKRLSSSMHQEHGESHTLPESWSRRISSQDPLQSDVVQVQASNKLSSGGRGGAVALPQASRGGGVLMRTELRLTRLQMVLTTAQLRLLEACVEGVSLVAVQCKSNTRVSTSLEHVTVVDCSSQFEHRNMLTVSASPVFSADVCMFVRAKNSQIADDFVDLRVSLQSGGARVVYLSRFLADMTAFFAPFSTQRHALAEVSHNAAEAAQNAVQTAYSDALRVRLDISLKAPLIIIPQNSTSQAVLAIDLGLMKITNQSNVDDSIEAVFDNILCRLDDVKMVRAQLGDDGALKNESQILSPVSFALDVKRCVSGPRCQGQCAELEVSASLGQFLVSLDGRTFTQLMSTLSENLAEQSQLPIAPEHVELSSHRHHDSAVAAAGSDQRRPSTRAASALEPALAPDSTLARPSGICSEKSAVKLSFHLRWSFVGVELFHSPPPKQSVESPRRRQAASPPAIESLGQFCVEQLSVEGRVMADNTMECSVRLDDCIVHDTRPHIQTQFRRLLHKSDEFKDSAHGRSSELVTVNFLQSAESEKSVTVTVHSVAVILHLPYFVSLAEFFSSHVPAPKEAARKASVGTAVLSSHRRPTALTIPSQSQMPPPDNGDLLQFHLVVEKPDIAVVENLSDADTRAVIFHAQVELHAQQHNAALSLQLNLNNVRLFTCRYGSQRRALTTSEIVNSFSVSATGNRAANGSITLDTSVTDVCVHVNAAAINLLTALSSSVGSNSSSPSSNAGESLDRSVDWTGVWDTSSVSQFDFPFLQSPQCPADEAGVDALLALTEDAIDSPGVHQLFIFKVSLFRVTVEESLGRRNVPLILMESTLTAVVRDWSSRLAVESVVSLEMRYFNSRLSVWEPLIERIEQSDGNMSSLVPLEFHVNVLKNVEVISVSSPISQSSSMSMNEDSVSLQLPALSISVSTASTLQLTLSRTCLDIVLALQESLSSAMDLSAAAVTASDAQLIIRNRLDNIATVVPGAGYRFLDQHIDQVLLNNECQVELVSCQPAPLHSAVNTDSIYVAIASLNWRGDIPIARAEPRFYRIRPDRSLSAGESSSLLTGASSGDHNTGLGFIADIKAQSDCRVVTLRSFVEVENNTNVPIKVYYMSDESRAELVCDTVIEPGQCSPLSIAAVNTASAELFFSCGGEYTVTSQPFTWRPLLTSPGLSRVLHCDKRSSAATAARSADAFYLVCDGRSLPVLFEGTRSRTMISRSLRLRLRPFAVLNNLLPVPVVCVFDGRTDQAGSIAPGTSRQLRTAHPGMAVTLRIDNYLDRCWSASQELKSDPPTIAVWNFVSADGEVCASLALGVHTVVVDGSLQMSLYSPFWMINQTGLQLTYQAVGDAALVYHPADYLEPIMFSFNQRMFFSKKNAVLKVDESHFSDKFSLDSVGSAGTVVCRLGDEREYALSVHISSRSGLTRQVLFLPGFVVVNNCHFDIEIREACSDTDEADRGDWILVGSRCSAAVWPCDRHKSMFVCRVRGRCSAVFSCASTTQCLLPLDVPEGGLHVDVQVSESSTSVTVDAYEDGMAAVRVINNTERWDVTYGQHEMTERHTLKPGETRLFGWLKPTAPRLFSWSCAGENHSPISLVRDEIAEFQSSADGDAQKQQLYWVSFLDGGQRTLLFTSDLAVAVQSQNAVELERINSEVTLRLDSVGVSLVNNIACYDVLYMGISSSGVVWEAQKTNGRRYRQLSPEESALLESAYNVYSSQLTVGDTHTNSRPITVGKMEVDFDTMMMNKPNVRRLRRTFLSGVWLQVCSSQHHRQLHLKIHRLQLDNQLLDCVFPVVLFPVTLPRSVVGDGVSKPFLEVSIVERLAERSAVTQFKYFKILLQEFHIKLDHGFLKAVLSFFHSDDGCIDRLDLFEKDLKDARKSLQDRVALSRREKIKHFYDYLHFSPIKVHVSFSMTGGQSDDNEANSYLASGFLELLLQSVGVTVTEIQDVVFKLAYFQRDFMFLGYSELLTQVQSHYIGQAVKQLYVLILGLDVLGNPFGLVVGLKDGVSDLFYEPVQGAIQGPGEFAEGLALGVKSLFSHAVGDTVASVSRITGTLGKGIAALTLDDEYKRRRREQLSRQPTDLASGLAHSGRGLVMGVFDGVSGVIRKPIEGAQEGGTLGFVKGVGVGMAGLFARPVSGAVDFASGSLNALRRSVESEQTARRLRPARHFHSDGVLRPYIRHEAEGAMIIYELEKGRYVSTDQYVAHCACANGQQLLIVTDFRLLLVCYRTLLGYWQTEWTVMLSQLSARPELVGNTLHFPLPTSKQAFYSLFSKSASVKQIQISDKKAAAWILSKVNEAIDQLE